MRRLLNALLVGVLVAGAVVGLSTTAHAAPGYHEGRCTAADVEAVTVVVDFQELGGTTVVRCATNLPSGTTGAAALGFAGLSPVHAGSANSGFLCRVAGRPSSTETLAVTGYPNGYQESCAGYPPLGAYWSYWVAEPGGLWSYSTQGAGNREVNVGGYEGWSFALNRTSNTVPPPRFVTNVSGTFRSIAPVRLLDSRESGGAFAGGQTRTVKVAGVGGVPADAGAVQLNLTAVDGSGPGFLKLWPTGQPASDSSALNFGRTDAVANAAVVRVGSNGSVSIQTGQFASTQVIVDVTGYFVGGSATDPGTYVPVNPARVADTRTGGGAVPGMTTRSFQIAGTAGIPSSVGAVAVNITAAEPRAAGHLSVVPVGRTATSPDLTSMLNFTATTSAVANSTVATVDPSGRITVLNRSWGTVHLVVDVVGYYRPGTATAQGAFVPILPTRAADTRELGGPLGVWETRLFDSGNKAGVTTASGTSALLNVTVVQPQGQGFLAVQPTGNPGSTLNFLPGQIVPNSAVAPVGTRVLNRSGGTAHVVLDVVGYYLG